MNSAGNLRIAISMMQKDEELALPIWLKYHESLFGSTSIFIFDNGSTKHSVLDALAAAESRGVHLFRNHTGQQAFIDKGEILTHLIQQLDATDCFDFYFPLDCDEFLGCIGPTGPDCRRSIIDSALMPYRGHPGTLSISHKLLANPLHQNRYQNTNLSRKCFFAHGSCGWMDHGYHHARSLTNAEEAKTSVIYFEFHYKPFREHRRSSLQKLLPFHRNLSRRSLREYAAKRSHNYHCAQDLLESRFSYLKQFTPEDYPIIDNTLLETLTALGVSYDALFEQLPPGGWRVWRFVMEWEAKIVECATKLREYLADGLRLIRKGVRWLARGK